MKNNYELNSVFSPPVLNDQLKALNLTDVLKKLLTIHRKCSYPGLEYKNHR